MKDVSIHYGDTKQVNPVTHQNYEDYLKNTEKKQELPGFDEQYLDIVDYVLKITHRIWEEKGVGVIYDTYGNECIVHSGDGVSSGVSGVIKNTLATLHAFPDRRLIAEDIVWSQDSADTFFSSHRILSTATNLGDSNFGPATGKKIFFRTVADCAIKNNIIYEEWLARDNLWIVEQLGLDAHALAKEMAKGLPAKKTIGCDECMEGQFAPAVYQAADDSVPQQLLELYNEVYNRKMINRICDLFTDNCVFHTICNRQLIGHDEIQGATVSLLSSFPNAKMTVDRITFNEYDDGSTHASVRWNLRGLHEGLGEFGEPSGNLVEILGISQYRFENGKITEAWQVYDGLDVLKQIYQGRVDQCEAEAE